LVIFLLDLRELQIFKSAEILVTPGFLLGISQIFDEKASRFYPDDPITCAAKTEEAAVWGSGEEVNFTPDASPSTADPPLELYCELIQNKKP
jgi:hypothetical protein